MLVCDLTMLFCILPGPHGLANRCQLQQEGGAGGEEGAPNVIWHSRWLDCTLHTLSLLLDIHCF